jgi:hypothetical protein
VGRGSHAAARAKVSWQNREHDERLQQVLHAQIAEAQPGDFLAGRRDERFMHVAERGFAGQGVSGGRLDAEEASVGAKPVQRRLDFEVVLNQKSVLPAQSK